MRWPPADRSCLSPSRQRSSRPCPRWSCSLNDEGKVDFMHAQKSGKKRIKLAAAVLLALASVESAHAASYTWDGGSVTTSNWTDNVNWSSDLLPPNDGTAD